MDNEKPDYRCPNCGDRMIDDGDERICLSCGCIKPASAGG